jgi:hypothetical protein
MSFLRFLMLLALVVWVGGLIFFPVVAATAFSVLPSAHLGGLVVRQCLIILHWMGMISGVVFLIASVLYKYPNKGRAKLFSAPRVLIALMLALTAASQFAIIPKMDGLRESLGDVAAAAASNPLRMQFDVLHVWSTRVEESVLLLGLIVIYVAARRWKES